MWRVTLTGLLAHKVRYALTALAVLLGVAFMAGTFVFTDTIKHTFDGLFSDVYANTSAVVRAEQAYTPGANFTSQRRPIDADLILKVRQVPGVTAVSVGVEGYAQLVGRDGRAIGNPAAGAPTLGEAWTSGAERMEPYRFVEGRPPHSPTEVAIDKNSANLGHLSVGDRVVVLTKQEPREYTISGIVRWGSADSPLGASITLFDLSTAQRVLGTAGHVGEIDVAAAPGISQEEMVRRLRAVLPDQHLEIITGAKVTEEGQNGIHQALSFFDTFLLVFAGIALFVGTFLIFNTFSIVVAQRMRELALLRAVGASRRQVVGSVLGEAFLIGLVASALGLGAGIALAIGLKTLLAALGFALPSSDLLITARTVVVSMVVGVTISLAAALVPAWKAGKVPPVAALREVEVDEEPHVVRRAVSGFALVAVGAALLLTGLLSDLSHRLTYVGVGAAAVFLGIAVAGPVLARPLCLVVGAPLRWRGGTGRLAQSNAMRNPKRTSAAAAALMIGVALVALISVMASSTKTSIGAVVDSAMRADFVVGGGGTQGGESGFSPTLAHRLTALPEVASATGVRSGSVSIGGSPMVVLAVDPRHLGDLFDVDPRQGDLATMGANGIAVSQDVADSEHLRVGDRLPVTFPTTGTTPFVVSATYGAGSLVGDYLLPLAAARQHFSSPLDVQVYARLAPGVTADNGRSAIEGVLAAYPNATLMDRTQYKDQQEAQIDQLLGLMYGLLGLALVIALIGIANTLALSIYERTRELGLMRAVGMTRRQLRSVIRGEAVLIALLGTVEGLVVGVLLGWAVVAALKSQGVTELSVPIVLLLVVAVLAALAGVLAAAGPAHRAAKLDVLRAISRH
jgi:putative ABC transport system permease protein